MSKPTSFTNIKLLKVSKGIYSLYLYSKVFNPQHIHIVYTQFNIKIAKFNKKKVDISKYLNIQSKLTFKRYPT